MKIISSVLHSQNYYYAQKSNTWKIFQFFFRFYYLIEKKSRKIFLIFVTATNIVRSTNISLSKMLEITKVGLVILFCFLFLFYYSLVFFFSYINLAQKYDVISHMTVTNITKYDRSIIYYYTSIISITVTVTQSYDLIEYYEIFFRID